jgi:integrase
MKQFRILGGLTVACDDEPNRPLPWVFPNVANDGPLGVKTFGKQLSDRQKTPDRRLAGRSKATTSLLLSRGRWTSHDLRRTAATRMAELGFSGDVIDECLNHMIESRIRRTYIRDRRLSEQRKAFDALGARLQALISGPLATKRTPRRVGRLRIVADARPATQARLPGATPRPMQRADASAPVVQPRRFARPAG